MDAPLGYNAEGSPRPCESRRSDPPVTVYVEIGERKCDRCRQGQKAMSAMRGESSEGSRETSSQGESATAPDRRIVAVYPTPNKNLLFSTDERVALWRGALEHAGLTNVRVEQFTGLIVQFAREVGAQEIVRGLRAVTDFEYEFQQALMNRKLAPEVETVMLVTSLRYLFISASLLKDVARLGGDLSDLAPPNVMAALRGKFAPERE